MQDDAIVVEGLEKSYGSVRALCGVDFAAPTGSVLGLLGPNGAGKTTAVRILATLLEPDGGTARVAGLDAVRDAAQLRAKIGLAGQYAAVDENLTGFENLEMVGRLYHMGARGGARARERVARALRAGRRRQAAGQDLLGRHAPAPRPGRGAHLPPAGALPRRAHDGPGPAQPDRHVGDDRATRGRGHHRAAHHPVPRRGRPARRPDRGHRPRHRDRRGHLRRAQGPRRRRAARGPARGSRGRRGRDGGAGGDLRRAAHARGWRGTRRMRHAVGRDRRGRSPARRCRGRHRGHHAAPPDARRRVHCAHRPQRRGGSRAEAREEAYA